MADDTDNLGPLLQNLAQYGIGAGGALGANAAAQKAYAAVLQNLKDRFGDYSKLGPAGYKDITAQQLGPSALGSIQDDAQARGDEQAAISQLGDIASSGGLELSDRNALNQFEQTTSRNNAARQNSLKNQFAARGQLGSGAELSMDLANNQNAAMNANQHGEDIAAQAQKRAMDAILSKGSMSRSLSNDDYARKKAAAEAADSIAAHNASLRTDASKYNNSIAGQNYDDALKKLQGETGLTNSMNSAFLGQGNATANNLTGMAGATGSLIGGIAKSIPKGGGSGGGGGSGSSSGDGSTDGNPDATGGRGGAADLSGGATDVEDTGVSPDELSWGNF